MAHRIIELDHISPDDCIFLLLREYAAPQRFRDTYPIQISTAYNTSNETGRVFQPLHPLRTLQNIKDFDCLVDEHLQGDTFIWYTQTCQNDICSLMVSKQNCRGYYIIEDGTGSYRHVNPAIFSGWKESFYKVILQPLLPRIFCVKNHFIETNHPLYKGCIATSERCFPLHQSHLRVIGNPFVAEPLSPTPDAILSIDALFTLLDEKNTEDIFRQMGTFISQRGYKHLVYKHHPYVLAKANLPIYQQYEQWIHTYFTIPMEQLPASACLENIATAHPCDFYTVFSSVAIYAHIAGCTCYSPLPTIKHLLPVKIPLIEEFCVPINT